MLRGGQQVHCYEPVAEREFRPLHHRTVTQALPVSALLALEHPLVGLPIMLRATAFRADNALFQS